MTANHKTARSSFISAVIVTTCGLHLQEPATPVVASQPGWTIRRQKRTSEKYSFPTQSLSILATVVLQINDRMGAG